MPRSDAAFRNVTAAGYAARAERSVPGLNGLHRMVAVLLAEGVLPGGHLLVLGAGGGLEIAALAAMGEGWRFTGIDPSADMVAVAREVCAGLEERVTFVEGDIHAAPDGPFDGAVSLMTFHFIPAEERAHVLSGLKRRLRPGSPLVIAHLSVGPGDVALERHAVIGEGGNRGGAKERAAMMAKALHIVAPEDEEVMLDAAGFCGIALFWTAFALRGWVARA
jgi:tRNA (cmo5U34)-methyltransferase